MAFQNISHAFVGRGISKAPMATTEVTASSQYPTHAIPIGVTMHCRDDFLAAETMRYGLDYKCVTGDGVALSLTGLSALGPSRVIDSPIGM